MKKRVIILGSTGSVGCNALDVLSRLQEEWEVVALAAGSRCDQLAQQANRFRPQAIAIARLQPASALRDALNYRPKVYGGEQGLMHLVESVPCDCVLCAVVGTSSLPAIMRAVEMGRRIALANKEAMVIAGSLLMPLAKQSGATILPVDSEHSAVFQALHSGRPCEVHKVYLTGSGGPFRTWSEEAMDEASVEDAMHHPTWAMGPKITIDSATMMNKALEVVEARWLFDLKPEQIEVVIHPESIIHSLVEFCDGSLIAQLSTPDMRTPIQYALTYPERRPCPSPRMDFSTIRRLNLHPPDVERFPALRLGHVAAQRGGTAGAVLNGANEAAVELFQAGVIRFREIALYAERALDRCDFKESPTLDELLAANRWARQEVTRCTA